MKNQYISRVFLALIIFSTSSQAQTWQQVWADEFNGSISSDWVFETGAGGWGNNELQYYRRENATVENGKLVITARRENFGGAQYTSARMKTQGKKSWKYGKIEARIAMPAFSGIWPAFWMLGDKISSTGWPACGEIDIMEHINGGTNAHATIHWQDANGYHAQYGGSTNTSVTSYHNYTVEWDAASIKWYLDGVKYHEANIANSVNGTSELHENFFLLLNMAVGGNWPGFNIDNGGFPAKMYVDYVRVFNKSSAPSGIAIVYKDCNFGGSAVGLPAGDYTLAALQARGVSNDDISSFHLQSGYEIVLYDNSNLTGSTLTRRSNINCLVDEGWNDRTSSIRIRTIPTSFTRTIQAESYSEMSGVQVEGTTDTGGGQNVGYIESGDWMTYKNINFPSSGTYKVEYRVAGNGGRLSLDLNSGTTVLGALNVPATGGWQNWRTISHTVNVNAGTYKLGLYAASGGWNINWIRITKVTNARTEEAAADAEFVEAPSYAAALSAYPNPAENIITINVTEGMENCKVKISDTAGNDVRETTLSGNALDISDLRSGIYILWLEHEGERTPLRVVKQ
ncbi:MAG: glycoside hydrolase family 16 [Cytophagaceae bacterium]|jgi:beta-glucanase (GH16 family)|nr:glycoside hydrolase family 16 [Cytophagaceae bacterium]